MPKELYAIFYMPPKASHQAFSEGRSGCQACPRRSSDIYSTLHSIMTIIPGGVQVSVTNQISLPGKPLSPVTKYMTKF